jgi:hypothetical protein
MYVKAPLLKRFDHELRVERLKELVVQSLR